MKILIDAMGGDLAPLEPIKGCISAMKEYDFEPILVGNRDTIEKCAKENGLDLSGIQIIHAETALTMEHHPMQVRSLRDNSLKVGFKALAEGQADAFVSAGNTGAIQLGANLFVRKLPGVVRSSIGSVLPMKNPVLLIDSGANTTFNATMFEQYAIMGSIYMKGVYNIEKPRVGLLNIGAEEYKGTEEHEKAFRLLSDNKNINFVGNVEGNAMPFGVCDVLVADGFSGNVLLKTLEGVSKFLLLNIKEALHGSISGKLGGAICKGDLKKMKKKFDATEHGGAPLLGIAAPVIKAHGNSNANAIKNAVRQAISFVNGNVTELIRKEIAAVTQPESSSENRGENGAAEKQK